jgi:hypothetical protein
MLTRCPMVVGILTLTWLGTNRRTRYLAGAGSELGGDDPSEK